MLSENVSTRRKGVFFANPNQCVLKLGQCYRKTNRYFLPINVTGHADRYFLPINVTGQATRYWTSK
jgi:hypothetical protein